MPAVSARRHRRRAILLTGSCPARRTAERACTDDRLRGRAQKVPWWRMRPEAPWSIESCGDSMLHPGVPQDLHHAWAVARLNAQRWEAGLVWTVGGEARQDCLAEVSG